MFIKAARASAVREPSYLKNTLFVKNMKISHIFYGKKMFERKENGQSANFFGFSDPLGNH
jgi:hypothetical protein